MPAAFKTHRDSTQRLDENVYTWGKNAQLLWSNDLIVTDKYKALVSLAFTWSPSSNTHGEILGFVIVGF